MTTYRYPEVPAGGAVTARLHGPEQVFRFRLRKTVANFGVAIVSARPGVLVQPRVFRPVEAAAIADALSGITPAWLLSRFDLKKFAPLSVERFHIEAEAARIAYMMREQFIGDPQQADVDVARHARDIDAGLRRNLIAVYAFLIGANVFAWIWAFAAGNAPNSTTNALSKVKE